MFGMDLGGYMKNVIKVITRENMEEELERIKEINPNAKFWSISKINNFNNCKRSFYYTYINKKEQKQNIYSILGSSVHADYEDFIEGRTDKLEPNNFKEAWIKTGIFGIKFMSDSVKNNWKKDIDEMYKWYKKPSGELLSEVGFILKLSENDYLQGYIDLIKIFEDGSVGIYDYKTSSKFDKKKMIEAGRQLAVYQLAIKELYNLDVIENGWIMSKYLTVKVGDYKPKNIVSAREWVSKCSSQIINLNKKEKYIDNDLLNMLLSKCEIDNNIDILPQEIKDRISVETCFVSYEVTEDVEKETKAYILNTIKEIEKLNIEEERDWEVNVNEFFCSNLCSFSGKYCQYWKNK